MNRSTEIQTSQNEPFVKLQDGADLKNWSKDDEIIYNQQLRQKAKVEFYQQAFEFIRAQSIIGDYFEFGCHKVRTFRMALTEARKKNIVSMNFYAFDSFDGLPDLGDKNSEHNDIYNAGALTTSEKSFMSIIKEHKLFENKVHTVKGFYENSLTNELKNKLIKDNAKIAFVTLDCSFYDSFVDAFNFIENFIQEGTIIYIDDYRVTYKGNPTKGAPKAFKEFQNKSQYKFEPFLDIGWFGKSFIAYKD